MPTDLNLSHDQLTEFLKRAGFEREFQAELLGRHNHMWRIRSDGGVFFLKAHTRDWYDWDPPRAASLAVSQEASAYRILSEAGLPTPEIVHAELTTSNPLGWPVLLMRALDGVPLTEQLTESDSAASQEILQAVGAYLGRMHSIEFRHPGYLIDGPPRSPPDPGAWQHWIWTLEEFRRKAEETWEQDRKTVADQLIDEVLSVASPLWQPMASQFQPPRFITGDCHASQFFVIQRNGRWEVTGVVDMEVASSGTPLADLFKFGVEMAGRFPADTRWWEPIFRGYDQQPEFDLVRLAFMSAEHINYKCLGPFSWPDTRRDILVHILEATDWYSLFDVRATSDRVIAEL